MSQSVYLGLEPVLVSDMDVAMEEARQDSFDFLVCNLAHPVYKRQLLHQLTEDQPPFTRSDLVLHSHQWSSLVVGKVSSVRTDSTCLKTKKLAEKTIQQEVNWAAHLSLPAILFPPPYPPYNNYSRILLWSANKTKGQTWVRMPMCLNTGEDNEGETWEWWNNVRTLTEHFPRIFLALEITVDLPADKFIDRWFGEPIRAIIVPTSIFITNKKGYPALSPSHQACIRKFFSLKVQYIISGNTQYSNGYTNYKLYVDHIINNIKPPTPQEAFESPFYDLLQAPLQPLKDNLESQTYEVFERDPIKYAQYQEAVKLALEDRMDKNIVLMVVGAGRGPLVSASLDAAREAKHNNVKIYAVEKNPNAVVTLRNKKIYYGWDNVTIIDCDMRYWNSPEKADILVSELLGSFGDNELSPECLDGAQRFLKDDGISIPESYTSFLSPMSCPKLWSDIQAYKDLEHFETSYVVKAHNIFVISPPQRVFHFEHPNRDEVIDNSREIELVFKARANSLIHGFIGYFSSKLYKDVEISIHPDTFSEGMFSWFPIYFPLRVPMYVEEAQDIHFNMWRICSESKVWYEWSVTEPKAINIHNPGGRSHWIGL